MAEDGVVPLLATSGVSATVHTVVLTREVPAVGIQAVPALIVLDALPVVLAEVAVDVVVDGAWGAIPRRAVETVVPTRVLVACEVVAMGLLAATREVLPDRTSSTTAAVVVGEEMATTIPTSIPLGERVTVRLAIQRGARMRPAETATGLAVGALRAVDAPLDVPILPPVAPALLPVGADVTPPTAKKAEGATVGVEVETAVASITRLAVEAFP